MSALPRLSLLLALSVLTVACPSDTTTPVTADTTVDAPDATTTPDVGAVDAADATAADTQVDAAADADAVVVGPKPVIVAADQTEVVITDWLISYGSTGGDNVVSQLIDGGVFAVPTEAGFDAYGVEWLPWTAEDGGLPGNPSLMIYAVALITTEAPTNLLIQTERMRRVWVNGGQLQPGNPYGGGAHRTPAVAEAGENVIVAQILTRSSSSRLRVYTTPDPVAFNAADVTWPHLRVGVDETQWLGLPIMNFTGNAVSGVTLSVVENDTWNATTLSVPALAAGASVQLPFELSPKASWTEPDLDIPVTLEIDAAELEARYQTTVTVPTRAADAVYRRTRISGVDGSVQYYGVNPPTEAAPAEGYGLILSLHGAGVQGQGQAGSYGAKPDMVLVAPTNRRPFGFDWEEWGREDGREAFEHALETFDIDPTRQYVTGHSMGGHGTWQFGVLFPDRFAVVGPSAGWPSFYTYQNSARPTGPFARSQRSSDTEAFVSNLAEQTVYIVHGTADDNVPIGQAYIMVDALEGTTTELETHWEDGAGHWWDGYPEPGAACVDWPPMMELMTQRTREVSDLDFDYVTPGTWVNERFSYVTLLTSIDYNEDIRVISTSDGAGNVTLSTTNAYALQVDTAALQAAGVTALTVDGEPHAVDGNVVAIGPQDGKTPEVHGPYNQVYHRPFCFAYADDKPRYAEYAAFLLSNWNIIGNGHGCALPASKVTDTLRAERNIIWLGVSKSSLPQSGQTMLPFLWDDGPIAVGGQTFPEAMLMSVFPTEGRLNAVIAVSPGAEHLMFRLSTFHSGFALPDYMVLDGQGIRAAGFYGPDWSF